MTADPDARPTLVGIGLLVGVFGCYLSTMYPTISAYRDNGEHAVAAATHGHVHAPGYPLYHTLGRVFTMLPFGTVAYRTNLQSAAAGAVAVWLVYRAALRLAGPGGPRGVVAALAGAAGLAATPTMWRLAQVGEEYTTAAAWAGLLLNVLLDWTVRGGRTRAAALGLAAGLGTGVHMTLLMLVPGALVAAGPKIRQLVRPVTAAAFLLGAGLFLIPAVRAAAFPRSDWGHPATWQSWWAVVTRQYVGTFTLDITLHESDQEFTPGATQIRREARDLVGAWTPVFLALGALGAWTLLRERPWLGAGLATTFLGLGPGFRLLAHMRDDANSRALLEPHDILPGIVIALWVAAGTAWLAARLAARGGAERHTAWGVPAAAALLAGGLLWGRRPAEDRRYLCLAYDTGRMMLRGVEPGGVVLARGDIPIFLLNYLTVCDRVRPDVRVVPNNIYPWRAAELKRRFPDLTAGFGEEYAYDFRDRLVRQNLGRTPILLVGVDDVPGVARLPEGLVQRVTPLAASPRAREASLRRGMKAMRELGVYRAPVTHGRVRHYYEQQIVLNLVGAWYEIGRAALALNRPREAADALAQALGMAPQLAPIRTLLAQVRERP